MKKMKLHAPRIPPTSSSERRESATISRGLILIVSDGRTNWLRCIANEKPNRFQFRNSITRGQEWGRVSTIVGTLVKTNGRRGGGFRNLAMLLVNYIDLIASLDVTIVGTLSYIRVSRFRAARNRSRSNINNSNVCVSSSSLSFSLSF